MCIANWILKIFKKHWEFRKGVRNLFGKMIIMKDRQFIRDWISGLGRLALSRIENFWGAQIGNSFWGPRECCPVGMRSVLIARCEMTVACLGSQVCWGCVFPQG